MTFMAQFVLLNMHNFQLVKIFYFNPNGHGKIYPHFFLRPITQKVLKCKKSAKNIYSMEIFCWIFVLGYVPTSQKTSIYVCFMPQNRPLTEKKGQTAYTISHSRCIFAHIQVGGLGGRGGRGKPLNRVKVRSRQQRSCLFTDCEPHRPLSTFCLI